ncbi:hypothetical protein [Vitreoscilla stercoraria]|uniref:Chorismate mutase n=1 Tax=Vitreoscilla stercoraria TaxID=61 RepID=A0ABY4E735_VITST|nr:hypothetical protein [Vitreoscilla stercoraria]UOO91576.1 chorismate mutase [Vitreoscilla stercoraria]
MIIVMQPQAAAEAIEQVVQYLHKAGLREHISVGAERVIIGAVGDERVLDARVLEQLPQVERAVRIVHDWRIISREAQPNDSVYVSFGVFLGQELLNLDIKRPENSAVAYLDPFYIPHSPYQAQTTISETQLSRQLVEQVASWHQQYKPVMVRVRDLRQLDDVLAAQADMIYVGGEWLESRVMHQEIGRLNVPVVVCKDKHHTLEQWLVAAERVAMHGNHQLILGEAGTLNIQSKQSYRLDIEAIAQAVKYTHLPVLANVTRLGYGVLSQAQLGQLAAVAGAKMVLQDA